MLHVLDPPIPDATRPQVRWQQLAGSAVALALAEAAAARARLHVVLVPGARELERLAAELAFFSGPQTRILKFPDWEILPYDLFSPHPDIVSERTRDARGTSAGELRLSAGRGRYFFAAARATLLCRRSYL